MPKAPKENTHARNALTKKNDSAVDELQQQVAMEKKKHEGKKKEQAEEKKAEEERRKKSDQEKAKANAVTISPPNVDDATAGLDTMVLNADDKNIDQTDNWTESEDTEALTRYSISPNHLFGIEAEETTTTTTTEPTEEAGMAAWTKRRQLTSLPLRTPPREKELRVPTYRA
jgi:hypothetical protein